jgi:Lon protease-like protein
MKDVLGVFALPRVVLFPGATLPMHVFEPRYRSLVRDALDGERAFALALLKPGYEPYYEGTPDIYPIGCAGHIDDVVPLPDGRFLLTLTGTSRVEFGTMTSRAPYRRHQVRYLDEREPEAGSPAAEGTLLRLLSAHQQIVSALSGRGTVPLGTGLPFAETVNRIALALDIDPSLKYGLLEDGDVEARAERIATLLESALPGYLGGDDGVVN